MCMSAREGSRLLNVIGVDMAAKDFQVCARTDKGELQSGKFVNTLTGFEKLKKWASTRITDIHLIMEATGRYWKPLAKWALEQGWKVTVLNPRQARDYASSQMKYNKTDAIDAKVLLRFGESARPGELRFWQRPSENHEILEELQGRISSLKKCKNQEQNRLKSGLVSERAKQDIRNHIEYLEKSIKALQKEVKALIMSDEKLRSAFTNLSSIIGLGETTAILLMAKIDFDLFQSGRQLVALAGLVPRFWESGTSVKKKTVISRVGHSDLRAALYLPAISAMKHDPGLLNWVEGMEKRGKPKKVMICAVMARLLQAAFAVVRDDRPYEVRSKPLISPQICC
jgi:transposase